ncbi:aminopeptidase N [Pseudokineococcus lusitanus]|uniref:Aminopeptidase N n=1 Tax=Pseudokineococcus lusitanus TaxID=763993 RepID=A0A3N1HTN3_9ACTN|nr:aminopeptidase N [Pseudokineococcus lusitanus]ROP45881.1 membrane alanyl aminopeptidase [Pseudokineococcus lusitanus]
MPGTNLTRDEARQRAELVAVDSYDVTLDLTRGADVFTTTTVVRFRAAEGASTWLDLVAPSVTEVEVNGERRDPSAVADGARVALDGLAEENVVRVVADGAYMTTGEGLHRFVDPVDDEVYLYSQFEVADARRVFAVFEQPDLKATFRFTVTAPDHWTVVSVQPTPEPTTAGPGRATWSFEPTPRLAPYVTAVVAGPYHRVDGELTSSDGRTVPLGVLCRASLAEHLDAEEVLDVTRRGFAHYERLFDLPYPFAKYDQLFVPEFNAGAMENAGAVTFLEDYVFRSRVPEAMVERRAVTILHELAHMWFGDLVTMRWWDDLWLNESFAEYASTQATAEATRWSDAWTTFSIMEKSWAYRQDQLPSTHPVVADIRDLEDVEVNFDGITYAKGASVLTQLVSWVGREHFDEGVRRYFRRHAYGSTQLADLLVELEATSGRDLRSWSRVWLEQAGVTTLRPEITVDDEGRIASLAVLQEAPAEHPVLRPHRLAVGCYERVDDRLRRTHRVELDVDGERTEVPDLVGVPRPDLLLLNDDDLAYAKVRLDPTSLATAVADLPLVEDGLARALVWGAVWDMTRDAETPVADFVELVLRGVTAEQASSSVVLVLLRQLGSALRQYVAQEHREAVRAEVAGRLLELTRSAPPGSDLQLQLLRASAAHAATPDQLSALRGVLDGRAPLPGLAVDVDLGWELLTALVAAGDAGEDEVRAMADRDDTARGRRLAVTALAARPEPAVKEEVWASVVDRGDTPVVLQGAAIDGFTRVRDVALLAPFVDRYFDAVERVWAERTNETAQQVVLGLFPDQGDGADVVARTTAWLDAHPDAPSGLRRLTAENRDGVLRAQRAQELDRRSRA